MPVPPEGKHSRHLGPKVTSAPIRGLTSNRTRGGAHMPRLSRTRALALVSYGRCHHDRLATFPPLHHYLHEVVYDSLSGLEKGKVLIPRLTPMYGRLAYSGRQTCGLHAMRHDWGIRSCQLISR